MKINAHIDTANINESPTTDENINDKNNDNNNNSNNNNNNGDDNSNDNSNNDSYNNSNNNNKYQKSITIILTVTKLHRAINIVCIIK